MWGSSKNWTGTLFHCYYGLWISLRKLENRQECNSNIRWHKIHEYIKCVYGGNMGFRRF